MNFNSFADILQQRDNELAKGSVPAEQRQRANLLGRIIERDLRFSFDELEDLAEILANCGIDHMDRTYGVHDVSSKKVMLPRIIDKITETRVMA
jgi:hypothetical protein